MAAADLKSNTLTDQEKLHDLLIHLAKHARSDRFYPFPEAFKTIEVKTDTANLPTGFIPYAKEDFDKVARIVSLLNVRQDLSTLDTDEKQLIDYIYNVPVQMSYFGNKTIHKNIEEFEFKYSRISEAIRDFKYPKRWYLFHGSPLGNWHSIIRNGIRLTSKTTLMTTGAVHGVGVYSTNELSMACSYGNSGQYGSCVAVIELFVDYNQHKKTNRIYVIPSDDLFVIRYLYRIKGHVESRGNNALDFYTRMKNMSLSKNKMPTRRLEREEADLKSIGVSVVEKQVTTWTVSDVHNNLFNIHFLNYPFKSPLITTVNELARKHPLFIREGVYTPHHDNWTPRSKLKNIFTDINQLDLSISDKPLEL